jgi:hypothetical protein
VTDEVDRRREDGRLFLTVREDGKVEVLRVR